MAGRGAACPCRGVSSHAGERGLKFAQQVEQLGIAHSALMRALGLRRCTLQRHLLRLSAHLPHMNTHRKHKEVHAKYGQHTQFRDRMVSRKRESVFSAASEQVERLLLLLVRGKAGGAP